MKDTIYLIVNRWKVERMTKNVPQLKKGDYVCRVDVTVKEDAFTEPMLVKEVTVENWREGVDVSDIEFSEPYITEEEATIIRERREKALIESLKAKGYKIEKVEKSND